jgi:adenine-specific DNA-methyltransferase
MPIAHNLTNLDFKSFPSTRYQGSKRKLLPWLYKHIQNLKFNSALDIFGGTATVSYLFKKMGKRVTFNDYLRFNYLTGKALIENENISLNESDISFLITKHRTITYKTFVQDTFQDIYFTDEENAWIDRFLTNWTNLSNIYADDDAKQYKRAISFYAFSQSALKKRPFNLFHRANLYLRLSNINRSFGNKTSWEGSFEHYFKEFSAGANKAIFSNKKKNVALNVRVSEFVSKTRYDLVYVDPPYVRKEASGSDVDYLNFYHFLEGAIDYDDWGNRINYNLKNLRIEDKEPNEWTSTLRNSDAFAKLFSSVKSSIVVVSYKEPGIPCRKELIGILRKYKNKVISIPGLEYKYALNKNNGFHKEYLLIGID